LIAVIFSIHPHNEKKERKKNPDENLPEASRIDLRVKTSTGGSHRSEE
jgi:hypothetical protein